MSCQGFGASQTHRRKEFATSEPSSERSPESKATVRELLRESSLPRDALPYTDEFTRLKKAYEARTGDEVSDVDFWRLVWQVGKRGGLGEKGTRKRAPGTPRLTTEEQLEVLRLFPEGIGDRDRLPYTPEFNRLHRQFTRLANRQLTKHEFWRAVSRIAKRSRKPRPVFDTAPLGGLPRDMVQFLERTNPWWRGQPDVPAPRFRRWAFRETVRRLEVEIAPAIAIRGPRQVGKTTIQRQLIEQLLFMDKIGPERILRVQFDETPALGSLKNPIEAIVRWYEENVLRESINALARRGTHVYLFFDELQNLPQWSSQLKSLVDHIEARTLVTGSSALRIARGRDSLAGRLSTIELGPLRLHEIAGMRSLGELEPLAQDAPLEDLVRPEFWIESGERWKENARVAARSFLHFSRVGGYPICHNDPKLETHMLADQIVEVVVNRTIDRDPVKVSPRRQLSRDVIRETFRLICRYAGQRVTPDQLSLQINQLLRGGVSAQEIADSIQWLVDSMLVHRIQPLELLGKKQTSPPKLCLCDHFVRNAWLQETVPLVPAQLRKLPESTCTMAGHIIESTVGYYLMGIQGLEVAWFPQRYNEPEVDFVLTIGVKRIPIEVKYRRGRLKNEDYSGLLSFCGKRHYGAEFGVVITQDQYGKIADSVIALPATAILLLR